MIKTKNIEKMKADINKLKLPKIGNSDSKMPWVINH